MKLHILAFIWMCDESLSNVETNTLLVEKGSVIVVVLLQKFFLAYVRTLDSNRSFIWKAEEAID